MMEYDAIKNRVAYDLLSLEPYKNSIRRRSHFNLKKSFDVETPWV